LIGKERFRKYKMYTSIRYEVPTAVSMKSTVFRVVTQHSLAEVYGCFEGRHCLHLQGGRISQASRVLQFVLYSGVS
jgi:hypothetical protein